MKKIKFILPAMAFVFAIVASFATVNAKTTVATKRVSYPSESNCKDIGSCTVVPMGSACTDGIGNPVREFESTSKCDLVVLGTWD